MHDGNNIRSVAGRLVVAYENDLETDIYDEFVQFHKLLKTDLGKPLVEQHQSAESVELRMYKLITGANLHTVFFQNIEVGLRIYLCLMVTNCSGEHSFSKLKRIKNELRSTMHQERLNRRTLISLEHEVLHCTRENSESWSISSPKSNLEKLTVILDVPLGLGLNVTCHCSCESELLKLNTYRCSVLIIILVNGN